MAKDKTQPKSSTTPLAEGPFFSQVVKTDTGLFSCDLSTATDPRCNPKHTSTNYYRNGYLA